MIHRLRRRHRWLWAALAALLPALLWAALAGRTDPLEPLELPQVAATGGVE